MEKANRLQIHVVESPAGIGIEEKALTWDIHLVCALAAMAIVDLASCVGKYGLKTSARQSLP